MYPYVQTWISHYGYAAVFSILVVEMVGIPLPAKTALIFCGFYWMKGIFLFFPLLLCAAAGNIMGSSIAYGIGYSLGRPIVIRFGRFVGIKETKLDALEKKFIQYRVTVVLFAKFLAGIRVLAPYLAGINQMPFLLFSICNAASALIWAAFFIFIGRYASVVWNHYHRFMHQPLFSTIILILIFTGLILMIKTRRK